VNREDTRKAVLAAPACKPLVLLMQFGVCLAYLVGCGGGSDPGPSGPPSSTPLSTGPERCVNGAAGSFACSGIALRSRVPLADMGGVQGNDIWGWVDAQTGNEYALMGMTNGTAFVDVTDPENPRYLGILPTATFNSVWRDIKVYRDHAYVVADSSGAHGMQVFDLTRLRDIAVEQIFTADIVYRDFATAHNIAIDEDTGFAYVVGSNTCGGGLHIVDLSAPNNPLFAGCYSETDTHDTQCVLYSGPDAEHSGSEICVSSNENHVGIIDVTLKSSPVEISRLVYPDLSFTHQGWLTEDQRYFFLGDEGDEIDFGVATRTHILDLTDLDAPQHLFFYSASTNSIDHNMYVRGDLVYQANYTSGLRVLEFGDLSGMELAERWFFDTYPAGDQRVFDGAWSVYPFLPSGNIIVSDMSSGLFVLTIQ